MATISAPSRRTRLKRGGGSQRRCKLHPSWTWILCLLLVVILYVLVWNRCHRARGSQGNRHHHKLVTSGDKKNFLSNTGLRFGQPPIQQQIQYNKYDIDKNSDNTTRFLIYRPPFEASQGVGNLMQGLLAAHFLGDEFDRVVCVDKEWTDFLLAFDILTPECIISRRDDNNVDPPTNSHALWVLNFGRLPVNECRLRDRLKSLEPTVVLVANTYPEWPSDSENAVVANNTYFQQFYKPRRELLTILPWKVPPPVVVHLRQPDDVQLDPRKGLDADTLRALGTTLPDTTFLVTNQVDYYGYFQTNFGWSHPSWHGVSHSAKADVKWDVSSSSSSKMMRNQNILELWSDWWTLYSAQRVYHTHSDFSESAVHWSGAKSHAIQGVDGQGQLLLEKEGEEPSSGISTSRILPLSERANPKHCDLQPSGLDGLGYVFDLDDEYHDDLQDDW
jgi:hypothetical protein